MAVLWLACAGVVYLSHYWIPRLLVAQLAALRVAWAPSAAWGWRHRLAYRLAQARAVAMAGLMFAIAGRYLWLEAERLGWLR